MRKLIAAILSLSLLLTLSGCRFSLKPTYWNGMTKQETEEFILSELEEKYDEEFEIIQLSVRSTGYVNTHGYLKGFCSPKSDDTLVFEIERWLYGNLDDTYIQSIVRREMKDIVDAVLSKHCDEYAVEIEVKGLSPDYDSGIRLADNASIQTYTEALPQENSTSIIIVLNESIMNKETDDEIVSLIMGFVESFYYTKAFIDCYYVPFDILEQCVEVTDGNNKPDLTNLRVLVSGRYPKDDFVYTGTEKRLALVETDRYNLTEVKRYELQ